MRVVRATTYPPMIDAATTGAVGTAMTPRLRDRSGRFTGRATG
jgi:hypothetical protein